jgi:glycosyltransferase involved in cell wall biosynthesis
MLQVLARLDKDIKLWIVGKEDERELEQLKRLIHKLRLWNRVKFFGGLDNRELPAIYARASVLANTSETEGICFSFLEAMAFQLPIVAWDVGGNSGVVENGITGYLAKFGDIQAMVIYISYLLEDNEEFRKRMGLEACFKLRREFDIKKNVQKLLKVYSEVLKGGKENLRIYRI